MSITVEGQSTQTPDEQSIRIVTDALSGMGVSDCHVVLSTNFEQSIQHATGDPNYNTDRTGGFVAGKTIGDIIYINSSLLAERSNDPATLAATITHEAGHVLLNQRGEDVDTICARVRGNGELRQFELSSAIIALEEYRITRAVHALGHGCIPESFVDDVGHYLESCAVAIYDAWIENWPSVNDPDPGAGYLATQIILWPTVQNLAKILNYCAAEVTSGDRSISRATMPTMTAGLWAEFAAPCWDNRLNLLNDLPDARTQMTPDAIDTLVPQLVDVEESLLSNVGFAHEYQPDGVLNLIVTRDEEGWTQLAQILVPR